MYLCPYSKREREEEREREREALQYVYTYIYPTRKLIAARTDEGNEGRSSLRLAYNIKQSGLNE